jgi:hypothetical protein|tara:strand:- start:42899 stop:43189 length:291 start_codon:yes stop_codon:yes gene_type:complete
MFERDEESDRINNVTWKGALCYLERFINPEVINLINKNNISEQDSISLLSVSPKHIHLARKTYLLEHNTVWGTTNNNSRRKWSNDYTVTRESSLNL